MLIYKPYTEYCTQVTVGKLDKTKNSQLGMELAVLHCALWQHKQFQSAQDLYGI